MIVRVAKIDALAAFRPAHFAFNRDAAGGEMFLPLRQILFRHREGKMQLACGIVRRNHPPRSGNRLHSSAAAEYQKYLLVRDAEHAEPLARFEQTQSELLLVKTNRAREITRINAWFNDTV